MIEYIQPALLILIIGSLGRCLILLGRIQEFMSTVIRIQDQHRDEIDTLQVQANELDGDVRVLEARLRAAGINGAKV